MSETHKETSYIKELYY